MDNTTPAETYASPISVTQSIKRKKGGIERLFTHLEIHQGAAQKRDRQEYRGGDLKYFQFTMLIHVRHQDDGTERAED